MTVQTSRHHRVKSSTCLYQSTNTLSYSQSHAVMGNTPSFLQGDSIGSVSGTSVSMLQGLAYPVDEGNGALPDDGLRFFPFFKLPLELRREVYNYVLVEDKQPLRLVKRTKADGKSKNDSIAVLTTSRQVNLEAYPIFLSLNTFEICGTNSHWQWLKKLGPDGQKALRNVVFSTGSLSYNHSHFRTFNILAGCPKISLTINVHFDQLLNLYRMGIFRYLHGFSRATCARTTVEANGDLDAKCSKHGSGWRLLIPCEDSWSEYAGKRVQVLLEQSLSACPKNCKVHKARTEPHSASVVHFMYGDGCPVCYARLSGGR